MFLKGLLAAAGALQPKALKAYDPRILGVLDPKAENFGLTGPFQIQKPPVDELAGEEEPKRCEAPCRQVNLGSDSGFWV